MRGSPALSPFTTVVCLGLAALGCDSSTGNKGAFTLALSEQTASVGQGAIKAITITIARSNFDKPVALVVDGLPTGVTATLSPTPVPGVNTSSILQLTVAGTTAPATSVLTVRGTGEGAAEQSATIQLTITVTGSFTLAALESPTVAQGGGGNSSLLVNRIAGFAGNVELAVTGAPAGMTATLGATSTSGNSVSLTIAASASVPAGTYALTATGTAMGLPVQSAQISVNVIAAPATSGITMAFCSTLVPAWLAYKNEGFAWQQVSAVGNAFSFSATARLSVAYTYLAGSATQVNVFYATRAELAMFSDRDCNGTKSLSGTVSGLGAGKSARIGMGNSAATVTNPSTTFNFTTVNSRPLDLVATRGVTSAAGITPDKMIIRRSLDLATTSIIPPLDFEGADAFTPVAANIGVTGTVAGEELTLINTFWSVTSTFGQVHAFQPSSSNAVFHVPAAQLIAGDLHELYVAGDQPNGQTGHLYVAYFATPADRTVALGPYLSTPVVSTVSVSPYVRMRGQLPVQSEYSSTARFGFFQAPAGSETRLVFVAVTAGYLGSAPATAWDNVIPDFGSVPGFSTTWMLQQGTLVQFIAEAYSGRTEVLFGGLPVAGDFLGNAYRVASTSVSGIRAAGSRFNATRARPQYFSR